MKPKPRSVVKSTGLPKVVISGTENLSSRDISFVVQGQIQSETYDFLQKLRWNFPQAELVLSTWRGKYDRRLLRVVDKIVYNKDPGGVVGSYYREVA